MAKDERSVTVIKLLQTNCIMKKGVPGLLWDIFGNTEIGFSKVFLMTFSNKH